MKNLTFKQIITSSIISLTFVFGSLGTQASTAEEVTNSRKDIEISYGIDTQITPQNENENLDRPTLDPTKVSSSDIQTSNLVVFIFVSLLILWIWANIIDNDDDNDDGNGGGGTEARGPSVYPGVGAASFGGGCGGGGGC